VSTDFFENNKDQFVQKIKASIFFHPLGKITFFPSLICILSRVVAQQPSDHPNNHPNTVVSVLG
jgi:hypothetical protein